MKRVLAAAALAACLSATGVAHAQSNRSVPAPRSNIPLDEDPQPNVPPRLSTLPPTRGISGLRLEPGAVLCQSEADLQHRNEVSRRIADGEADAGTPLAGCRILAQERGVEVLARSGLSRSEVRLKPSGEVGWTDAYLR